MRASGLDGRRRDVVDVDKRREHQRVDIDHNFDGPRDRGDDPLVVINVGERKRLASPVLEPLLADLIAADMEFPDVRVDPPEVLPSRAGLAVVLRDVDAPHVDRLVPAWLELAGREIAWVSLGDDVRAGHRVVRPDRRR